MQGPIGRFDRLGGQLFKKHKFGIKNTEKALQLILYGMFKKMILADNAAMFVNKIFHQYRTAREKLHIREESRGFHIFRIIRTFILVNISWLFDMADTVGQAWQMFFNMLTKFHITPLLDGTIYADNPSFAIYRYV